MAYKFDSQCIGYPPVASLQSSEVVRGGFVAAAEDPVYGGAELVFARANGSIRNYGLCAFTPVWDGTNFRYTWNATEAPNTTLLGRAIGVNMGGAMTSGQFGWFLITGTVPINSTASVAADTAFGITAAGQVGALAAGKEIVNARVVTAATQTVVKAATGLSGSNRIDFASGTDGFFVGGVLSGTGVGASAVVSFVDPLGAYILASVANSAAINGNVTQTANDGTIFYNVVTLNRAFAQSAIT